MLKKKTKKITGFLIPLLLVSVVFFGVIGSVSIFYDEETSPNIKHNTIFSGDEPIIISPFYYVTTYAPANSFGMSEFTEQFVNWSMLDNMTSYVLTCNDVDCTNLLTLNFTSVFDVNIRKYSYIFTPDKKGYYELTVSFDSQSNGSWIDETSKTVFFNYSSNEQLSYNFSDLYGMVGDFDFEYSLNNGLFILIVGTNINPAQVGKLYVLDPTFGLSDLTGTSSSAFTQDTRLSSWGLVANGNGVADNISISINTGGTCTITCSLYSYIDYSSSYAGNLIAVTENKTFGLQAQRWETLNFSEPKPSLVNNTKYYITVHIDYVSTNILLFKKSSSGYTIYEYTGYSYPFESPWVGESTSTNQYVIYCSYTVSGGEPSWTNYCPSGGNFTPTNQSINQCLKPTVSIAANDSNGGNNLTVNWYSNVSGTWQLYQTNSSVVANSTVMWNFSQANTGNTKYWYNVSIFDNECNKSYWLGFTTAANETPPPVPPDNPPTIETNFTDAQTTGFGLNCSNFWFNDTEGDIIYNWMNASNGQKWSVNNSNVTGFIIFSDLSCDTWIWVNCTSYDGHNQTWLNISFNTSDCPAVKYWLIVESPSPVNQSTGNSISGSFCIWINDTYGNPINYTINLSDNTGVSGSLVGNGSKCLTYRLVCGINYTVWVNASNGQNVSNTSYWFWTIACVYCPDSTYNYSNISVRWYVDLSSDNGSFNYSIHWNNDYVNATWANNGTYSILLWNISVDTTYVIWVNTSTNNCWSNKSYEYWLGGMYTMVSNIVGLENGLVLFIMWLLFIWFTLRSKNVVLVGGSALIQIMLCIGLFLYTNYFGTDSFVFLVIGMLIMAIGTGRILDVGRKRRRKYG